MNKEPYAERMFCPIANAEETVYFYERYVDGAWRLRFNGCDHNWHEGNALCEECHRAAYQKIVSKSKN